MKKVCLYCGEKFSQSYPNRPKKFCSPRCCNNFHHRLKPFTIDHDFKIFQNIAAMSETLDEFRELYKKYFTWEDLE